MSSIAIACQVVIALGIFNVWIVRRNRPTAYRPEGARDIQDEFRRYGLPSWMWLAVGSAKIVLAAALLVGIFVPSVAPAAAGLLALLMVAAVGAHVKVRDPLVKSVPALLMLLLSTVVLVTYSA
jgi:uncharacterized membrane protein YphA (DoxX/SURF4 family)